MDALLVPVEGTCFWFEDQKQGGGNRERPKRFLKVTKSGVQRFGGPLSQQKRVKAF